MVLPVLRCECKGLLGFIFGHNYHDVFEEKLSASTFSEPSEPVDDVAIRVSSDYQNFKLQRIEKYRQHNRIYILSICNRCGDIKKESQ